MDRTGTLVRLIANQGMMGRWVLRCFFWGLVASLTITAIAKEAMQQDAARKAVNDVFSKYPERKEVWPLSDIPIYTRVRPLWRSSFEPLRSYFSTRQQRNVDQFLHALADLLSAKDQIAKSRGITAKWWWPTGINSLQVYGIMSRDLLTDRSDNPDQMTISKPKMLNGKLEFTVKEVFTEVGQDRILGKGTKISTVNLTPEDGRWVIDEVNSRITDAYGDIRVDTLSQLLQAATKSLRDTEHAIQRLPQKLEIKKGQALPKGSQPKL
jgi:hypothetical protein